MIKVMHCISDTNFGGAGRVLLNYLNNYNRDDFEIYVVIPKESKLLSYLDQAKYRVIEFDGMYDRSYNRSDVHKLVKLIRELSPEIIHSHGALSARIAGKKCGKKVVYTRHSVFDLPAWQTSFWGKFLLGKFNSYYADRIIAVSPAAKDLLVESGTDADSIDVIFNGVEKMERASDDSQANFKRKYGLCEDDFVCTIMARLEEVKGHEYIIKAAKILKDRGINNIRILIAGTGGIEAELNQMAIDLQVDDIVVFVGFITDIPTLLSVTDIQLNASYGTEATSMALLEGFSMGVPAIVSDFGGNPYVVTDEINGLIFKKKDEIALADKIMKVKEDSSFRTKMIQGALNAFEEKFTAKKMAKNMEKIYFCLQGE